MVVAAVANMSAGTPPTPTPPIANFDYSPRDPIMGEVVAFTDTSLQAPTSWAWTRNGILFSTEQNPSLYFPLPGVNVIVLTATNSFGSSTSTASITVDTNR